ncbi:family 43 glycosylhydrolase [Ramlibacter sp. G-1-2-2]|uniref:Family 43 glycosylhydrolase n=1 Tax=Ramlibacter agri TaxID=2728837 RepID=A0A848H9F3_9BURK|nr:family 43 glycosylhydrolase [Ramlibacter agri]NML47124.1 family 43 glycosylhydrolase [Ramlibacter agri]
MKQLLLRQTTARLLAGLCAALVLASCGGGGDGSSASSATAASRTTALLQNFITDDPLAGDNGLPASPAAPLSYGPINMGVDVDGNAIQAVDEQDVRYFDGHYYLYGPSFTCGAFNYSPGVNTGPLVPTSPNTIYRYCGLTIYRSDDLMNWKLVGTQYLQDAATGEHFVVKKPRVVYSPKTGLYNLWFLDGQAGLTTTSRTGKYFIVQSTSPTGPWSTPFEPTVAAGALGPVDFSINTGPDGTSYIASGHSGVAVMQLNDEKTGTIDNVQVNIALQASATPSVITLGGLGISYHAGWWYLTGSAGCGNCVAASFYYLRAKDPHGPWMSPIDDSTTQPVIPAVLSVDSGKAQMHSAVMLPDGSGGTQVLVPGTHYRSNPLGAPGTSVAQSGDNNLALSGLYLTPLSFDAQGHIQPLAITPSYEFPLARPVEAVTPPAWQAALVVTKDRSVVQSWTVTSQLATIYPAVFQRTPDTSPNPAATATIQQPMVDAPLLARLNLPNGRSFAWTIDPRTVAWAPTKIALNLPEAFVGQGRVTLTLSTAATNGGYGVAVGKKGSALAGGEYRVVQGGTQTVLPNAEMLVQAGALSAQAPTITAQPRSLKVAAGSNVGFLVQADGVGLGYQWLRNGQPVLAPDGYNEWTTAALRLASVTAADSGTYTVQVFNQVGSVTSVPVTLEVTP